MMRWRCPLASGMPMKMTLPPFLFFSSALKVTALGSNALARMMFAMVSA